MPEEPWWKQAEELSESVVQRAEEWTESLAQRAGELTELVAQKAEELSERLSSQWADSDREVPVYLLPTGPEPEDYEVIFSVPQCASHMERGPRARARLSVWAARSDLDQSLLPLRIRESAQRSLKEERDRESQRLLEEQETALVPVQRRMRRKLMGFQGSILTGVVALACMVMLPLAALAKVGLIALCTLSALGFFGQGIGAIGAFLDRRQLRSSFQRDQRLLETQVQSMGEALQRPFSELTLHVHPELHQWMSSIRELEGLPSLEMELDPSGPSLNSVQSLERWRERMPEEYQPLLGTHEVKLDK